MRIRDLVVAWMKKYHTNLYRLLFRHYYYWMPKQAPVDEMIEEILKEKKDVFFIQIGANDGIRNDPLYPLRSKYSWKGILIEPQKKAFSKLQRNFQNNRLLTLVNAAISSETGLKQLYRLSFSEENWATARSSFNRETLERSIEAGIIDKLAEDHGVEVPSLKTEYITSEHVQCFTFDHLVESYHVERIDFLMIDTEGFDYEILKSINFDKYSPSVIVYEYKHLTLAHYRDSVRMMKQRNYKLYRRGESDIIAIHDRIK